MTPGYVYVAALSSGTVKVGRSQDAARRLREHKANARTLGLTVTETWTSPLHLEWQSNEDALKKIAADLGGIAEGREAFSGITFAAMVGGACELTFTAPSPPLQVGAAAPLRTVPATPPREVVRPAIVQLDDETLAFYDAMGRAVNDLGEGEATSFRQRHPHWASAFQATVQLQDAVRKLGPPRCLCRPKCRCAPRR